MLLTSVVSVLVGKDLLSALWGRDFLGPLLCIGKISNKFLLEQQCHHNRKNSSWEFSGMLFEGLYRNR